MATISHLFLVIMLIRNGGNKFDLIIADQISTGLPILKKVLSKRIIFYCHFPDLLLVKKDEAGNFPSTTTAATTTTISVLLKRILIYLKYFYRKLVFDRLEEFSLGYVDKILVNSQFTKKILFTTFPSIRKGIVDVLYPAVRIDSHFSLNSNLSPSFPPFVLSLNRFEKKKNIKLALESQRGLSVPLIIAGGYEGRIKENVDYLIELRSWCNLNKISHQTIWRTECDSENINLILKALGEKLVIFMPSISDNIRNILIKNSKCLIYTPMNEHFGIVPLESMSLGTPVVAMRSGGPIETIKDNGITGYLCDKDDPNIVMKNILKIVDLKSDDYDLLSERCKDHVKDNFSMSQFKKKLMNFL